MNALVSFCGKLQLGRAFAVLAASFVLLLNIACSNGNAADACPNNPPVQLGGQNNPYKAGGDGYNEYQMSTDPPVTKRDRASVLKLDQFIATANNERSFLARSNQGLE